MRSAYCEKYESPPLGNNKRFAIHKTTKTAQTITAPRMISNAADRSLRFSNNRKNSTIKKHPSRRTPVTRKNVVKKIAAPRNTSRRTLRLPSDIINKRDNVEKKRNGISDRIWS